MLLESSVSDAPSCGIILTIINFFIVYTPRVINYAPRVINYAPRVINYAPRVITYAPRNISSTGVTHDDCQ
jgi:hypothetical protein